MEVFEILKGQLYQSGAPQDAADWQPVHDFGKSLPAPTSQAAGSRA